MRILKLTLASLFVSTIATAGPITFRVEGTINLTQGPLLPELLDGANAADLLGKTVVSWITFDGDAVDANGSSNIGSYLSSGAPFGMRMEFPHRTFAFEGVSIGVLSDFDNMQYAPGLLTDLWSVDARGPGSGLATTFRGLIQLGDIGTATVGPDTALLDDSLPVVPPDISTFVDLRRMLVNAIDDENAVRGGIIADITDIRRVPEPATWSLLAGASGVLLAFRRRTRP